MGNFPGSGGVAIRNRLLDHDLTHGAKSLRFDTY
jgi:hypothetical protein